MHSSDGNLHAIDRHLAEREAYDAAQPETMYCGSCDETISSDDWPEFIDTETCPECEGVLCCSESDYEPSNMDSE